MCFAVEQESDRVVSSGEIELEWIDLWLQVILIVSSAIIMGSIFGLIFGLLDVANEVSYHVRLSLLRDEEYCYPIGGIFGGLVRRVSV